MTDTSQSLWPNDDWLPNEDKIKHAYQHRYHVLWNENPSADTEARYLLKGFFQV